MIWSGPGWASVKGSPAFSTESYGPARPGLKLWRRFLGARGTYIRLSEVWTVRMPGRSSLSHFACCVTTGPIARGEDHGTPGVDDGRRDASERRGLLYSRRHLCRTAATPGAWRSSQRRLRVP